MPFCICEKPPLYSSSPVKGLVLIATIAIRVMFFFFPLLLSHLVVVVVVVAL